MQGQLCICGKNHVFLGTRGSGQSFYRMQSEMLFLLRNREIAIGDSGLEITEERLAEIFLELQEKDVKYQSGNRNTLYSTDHRL